MTQDARPPAKTVSISYQAGIAVVVMDNPPVNALGIGLRQPLAAALETLRDDDAVTAIVLRCAGRTFIAGADISEFGKPMQSPTLVDLIGVLDSIDKPTIAALHGTVLGGGLELAMACHFRIAAPATRLGMPEVKLGLIPGATGTQRLPRLVGAIKAAAMIATGSLVNAEDALASGLIDAVADADLEQAALAMANSHRGTKPVRVQERNDKLLTSAADLAAFDAQAAKLLQKSKGLQAPRLAIASVRNSLGMAFAAGVAQERAYFLELLSSPESAAQRHLFFAERDAAKLPADSTPAPVARVGVIGGGTMGAGIAMAFINSGIAVTLLETGPAQVAAGLDRIRKTYGISVARGSLTTDALEERVARVTGTIDYADLGDCDLIVEAIYEDMAAKQAVFRELDRVAKPGAILASNTSYLDLDAIAGVTSRPEDVVGMHFFSPANVMRLVEVVRASHSGARAIASVFAVTRRIGKIAVLVGLCHGFVGNRMLGARSAQSEALLLEGAGPEQVDRAFTEFGWPMGPFQMGDLAGLDIGWRNRKALGKTAFIADALCEAGRFGQKTGKGYYRYEDGAREPMADPDVLALIQRAAKELGVAPRTIEADEIIERSLYPLINEGARILAEGISARGSDIDVIWANGYGFPAAKGGPMHYADSIGLANIVQRLDHWHSRTGADVFVVAPLLRDLAASGGSLADYGRHAERLAR